MDGGRELGGAVLLRDDRAPDSPMVNRIVGLGLDEPATETGLAAAIEALAGVRFYVALAPQARPPELESWLHTRGFEPGWGWMLFTRPVGEPPEVVTDLETVQIGLDQGEAFARVVAAGYGLPDAIVPWLASTPGATGWTCWLALADGEPAAVAALYITGEAGYLGFAATLPEHRGRGAQGALIAARVRHARELGCELLVTETGEQLPGRPSNSYRNILRYGFEERYVTANWIKPAPRG